MTIAQKIAKREYDKALAEYEKALSDARLDLCHSADRDKARQLPEYKKRMTARQIYRNTCR